MAKARKAPSLAEKAAYGSNVERRRFRARLNIAATPILTATANTPYAGFTATAEGGSAPRTFEGRFPTGITINANTGVVSGTPTLAGTYACEVSVRDAIDRVSSIPFTLTVS